MRGFDARLKKLEMKLLPDKQITPCAPYTVAEWICSACGDGVMSPIYKGCRGLEARNWTIVHFSNWNAPGKWETRRYCPKCGEAAIVALP